MFCCSHLSLLSLLLLNRSFDNVAVAAAVLNLASEGSRIKEV